MRFFGLGHKVSLPSLQTDTPSTSQGNNLRRRLANRLVTISPPIVAGPTMSTTSLLEGFYYPGSIPSSGPSHTVSNRNSSLPNTNAERMFSASTPCLSLPGLEKALPTLPAPPLPPLPEQAFSAMKDNSGEEVQVFSPLATTSTTPATPMGAAVPEVNLAASLPEVPQKRKRFSRRPLTSHPVTPEDLAFIASLRRGRTREVAPVQRSFHVRFFRRSPPQSSSPNRAPRLNRSPTPFPVRTSSSLRRPRNLRIQTNRQSLDLSSSVALSSESAVQSQPFSSPHRLSMIPESARVSQARLSTMLPALPIPPIAEASSALEENIPHAENPAVFEVSPIPPPAPRPRFAVLATASTANDVVPPPPSPFVTYNDSNEGSNSADDDSAVPSLRASSSEASESSIPVLQRLKRRGLCPGPRTGVAAHTISPSSSMEVEVHIDEVVQTSEVVSDSSADASEATAAPQHGNTDTVDLSDVEFIGFGAARVVCAVEGLMRVEDGVKVEKRCVKV